MRILLANPPLVHRRVACLEAAGHQVTCVTSVPDALARHRREPFPLVIADLPGDQGLALSRHLRALATPGYVHVLVLAEATPEILAQAAEAAGVDDLLPTSLRDETLVAHLAVVKVLVDLQQHLEVLQAPFPHPGLTAHVPARAAPQAHWD